MEREEEFSCFRWCEFCGSNFKHDTDIYSSEQPHEAKGTVAMTPQAFVVERPVWNGAHAMIPEWDSVFFFTAVHEHKQHVLQQLKHLWTEQQLQQHVEELREHRTDQQERRRLLAELESLEAAACEKAIEELERAFVGSCGSCTWQKQQEQKQSAPAQIPPNDSDSGCLTEQQEQEQLLRPSETAAAIGESAAEAKQTTAVNIAGKFAEIRTAPQDEQKDTEEAGKKRKFEHTTAGQSDVHAPTAKKVKEEQLEAEGPPTQLNPFLDASKVKNPKAKWIFKSAGAVSRTLEEAVRNMDYAALVENLTPPSV